MKVYEATLRPGERNKNDLGKQIYIPGYNIPFLIQPASAGEGAVGNIFAPNQSINGVQVGRGSNFRLQNLLAKAHPIIYYYTAIDPVEVTLKANKVVKGEHTLAQSEFTFNIVAGPNSPAIPETSQSKQMQQMVQLHLIRFHLQNQVLTLIQLQKIKLTLTQILMLNH